MLQKYKNILSNQKGQGLAEYGLIIALIAVVCIVAVTLLGGTIKGKFEELNQGFEGAGGDGGGGI